MPIRILLLLLSTPIAFIEPTNAAPVRVEPDTYNYEENSVKQIKVRGRYGRYITFTGKTTNTYRGMPGNCRSVSYPGPYGKTQSIRTFCTQGTPGGTENRTYKYELDCEDLTFDRKGDSEGGIINKGWMNIEEDPVANAVAKKYCPIINKLRLDGEEESVSFYVHRAFQKFSNQDYKGAISDNTKAIKINPDYWKAYNNRGSVKYELKDYSGAISDYNKAIEINPDYWKAYTNRGIAKELNNDLKGACDDWRKASRLGGKSTPFGIKLSIANKCD